MTRRSLRVLITAALALTACAPGPVTPTKPTPRPAGPKVTPKASVAPPTTTLASPITTAPGDGLISDAGSGLIGKVKAPTTLVSDAGSGLVSDAGSGVVSNNGAGYRLAAAPEQVPLAGLRVALLDAAGTPLVDAAGQRLEATTDALGAFAFAAAPPPVALIVAVELPGGKGRLEAIVPKAEGARRADVDLYSTLVSAYVGERYVRPQADPAGTLAKLPADVEAATRAKAEAAFGLGEIAAPTRLTTADAVAATEKLRAADGAFDGQMEEVRKLLVAAGQLDLGAGLPATEVDVRGRILLPGPDGALYVVSSDARVWRIGADGKAVTAAGVGTAAKDVDGVPGPKAGLMELQAAAFDAAGGLLLLERAAGQAQYDMLGGQDTRVTRLGPDGTLEQVALLKGGKLVAPGPTAGSVRVLGDAGFGSAATIVWELAPGAAPKELARLTDADGATVAAASLLTGGGDGRGGFAFKAQLPAAFLTFTPDFGEFRLDGATFALRRGRTGKVGTFALDAAGDLFTLADAAPRELAVTRADGTRAVLLADAPAGLFGSFGGLGTPALGADGKAYFQLASRTYRLDGGTLTAIAGLAGAPTTPTEALAIVRPAGIAPLPGGDLLVVDHFGHKVLRQAPDHTGRVVAGDGQASGFGAEPTGDALKGRFLAPTRIQAAADGSYYVLDNAQTLGYTRIRRVDAAGQLSDLARSGGTRRITDFVRAADGTVFAGMVEHEPFQPGGAAGNAKLVAVAELAPDGTWTDVYVDAEGRTSFAGKEYRHPFLALDAQGRLYWAGDGKLRRLKPDGTAEVLATDDRFLGGVDNFLAIDAQGRVVVTDGATNTISRWDPATRAFTAIAGAGTPRLAGSGVDDSLKSPCYPTFDLNGDLLVADVGNRQVKRIAAQALNSP